MHFHEVIGEIPIVMNAVKEARQGSEWGQGELGQSGRAPLTGGAACAERLASCDKVRRKGILDKGKDKFTSPEV